MIAGLIPHRDGRRLIRVEAFWGHWSENGTGAIDTIDTVPHNEVWHITGGAVVVEAGGVFNQLLIVPPWSSSAISGRSLVEDYTNQWTFWPSFDFWLPSGTILRQNATNLKSCYLDLHGERYIFEDTQ